MIKKTISKINDLIKNLADESDSSIKNMFAETSDEQELFALISEACFRRLNKRPFDVQIMGAIAIINGKIAEIKTGEGKSLIAAIAGIMLAKKGRNVHIMTVNEYLVRRDFLEFKELFDFFDISSSAIFSDMKIKQKKKAYKCQIVYGVAAEFAFDYLRDNIASDINDIMQRELDFAIIDEADSILLDEAKTPMILSHSMADGSNIFKRANEFVSGLTGISKTEKNQKDADYIFDIKTKCTFLTEKGAKKAEEFFDIENINAPENLRLLHATNLSMQAHSLHKRNVDYIVKNKEVVLIDVFTGRTADGKKLADGLHQAIEAKEGITTKDITSTDASITKAGFFSLYNDFSGMTGTIKTEKTEMLNVFGKKIKVIPTNKPYIRRDLKDVIVSTYEDKINAIVIFIREFEKTGMPMLIATSSIEHSVAISKRLKEEKIDHKLLTAENDEKEAYIIAQAGRYKAITVTTNIAGRGTDILLGGNPDYLAKERLLMRKNKKWKKEDILCLHYKKDAKDVLQRTYNKYYLEYKEHTDKEKEKVMSVGGLFILATEYYEAKRIDNQLKGRAGRQGEPGLSICIAALDDEIIRVNSNKNALKFFNLLISQKIDVPQKLVRRSQKQVELLSAENRKAVNNYDEADSVQREAFYNQRNKFLYGENNEKTLMAAKEKFIEQAIKDIFAVKKKERENALSSLNKKYRLSIGDDKLNNKKEFKKYLSTYIENLFLDKMDVIGESNINSLWNSIVLSTMDIFWPQYIDYLHNLRDLSYMSLFNTYSGLSEYKKDAAQSFWVLINDIFVSAFAVLLSFGKEQENSKNISEQSLKS